MPLIGSLILCDPLNPLVNPGISDLLGHDWNIRQIFSERGFPADKIPWNPELVERVQRLVTGENAHILDFELYWIAKVLPEPWLKAQILKNLASESHWFRFWSAKALVEVWGPGDGEVREAFLPFLDHPMNDVASVADMLPIVVQDKQACRAVFLRALASKPKQVASIIGGFRTLCVSPDDDEVFEGCLSAGAHLGAPLYQDQWRTEMILTFPGRPTIREMARRELHARDGAVGAIAKSYFDDEEMMLELSGVLRPLPEADRLIVVSALQESAAADDHGLKLLEACRDDTDSAVAAEATFGWMELLVARGSIGADEVEAMDQALETVGPGYDVRRTAAVIALAIAGRLDRFAQATEQNGELLKVNAAPMFSRQDERYIRRVLRYWPRFIEALGSENAVIERLQIKADSILPLINPIDPNAERLFETLTTGAAPKQLLSQHIQISALARFAPKSQEMRAMIVPLLSHWAGTEYWGGLIAAEVFAEHYAEDTELRRHVIDHFNQRPQSFTAAALAELLLVTPDADVEGLLRERTAGVSYDVASHFKLMAALSRPERMVEALEKVLCNIPLDLHSLHFPRWVPAIVRRVRKDAQVRAALVAALSAGSSPSVKASLDLLIGAGLWSR